MEKRHESILVIDDNDRLVESYRTFFEEEGFTVFSTLDGATGIELAQTKKPDIILLDLMLPKMNGLHVLEHLKADSATESIPVIVLTALLNDAEKDRSLELGAVAYFGKVDIDPKQLLKTVEQILAKGHHE